MRVEDVSQATIKSPPKPIYASFGFQVLAAMVIGLLLGLVARNMGVDASGNANWLTVTL